MMAAAGCGTPEYAVIDGKRVARPTVAYDNAQTFHLEHRRAFPGVFDAARGRDVDDGSLRGRVCGVDLAFDAVWSGARLELEGRGEVPWKQDFTHTEGLFKLAFDITELGPGHRQIRGSMSGGASPETAVPSNKGWSSQFHATSDGATSRAISTRAASRNPTRSAPAPKVTLWHVMRTGRAGSRHAPVAPADRRGRSGEQVDDPA